MKIDKISYMNFRGLSNMSLELGGRSIVLYGINGSGKTSILRGISLLFAQILNKVVENQFKQEIALSDDDITYKNTEMTLSGNLIFKDQEIHSLGLRYEKSPGKKKTVNKKEFSDLMTSFSDLYLAENNALPVFAHYGVNRAVLDVPLSIRTKHEFGELAAYQNAIGSSTDFRTFFEWFRNQEDIENERKISDSDLSYEDPSLGAVRKAICSMLPGLSDIKINRKPLRMCATKNGKRLNIEQLSDGEKCALAMLGDLARRLSIANPDSDDPLSGYGIVLIDEVELHMHPSWQRKIIPTLRSTFPNIQFIITTHSPLALSELPDDFKAYKLADDDGTVACTEMASGHYDVSFVLEEE